MTNANSSGGSLKFQLASPNAPPKLNFSPLLTMCTVQACHLHAESPHSQLSDEAKVKNLWIRI